MAVDKRFLRQQIVTQIERCEALAYAAGQHFLQHGEHAAASMQAQAEADVRLIQLIEDYAALGVLDMAAVDTARMGNEALANADGAPSGDAPSKQDALRALAFIEDIWEIAPDLPYTKTLRRFIEATGSAGNAGVAGTGGETFSQQPQIEAKPTDE